MYVQLRRGVPADIIRDALREKMVERLHGDGGAKRARVLLQRVDKLRMWCQEHGYSLPIPTSDALPKTKEQKPVPKLALAKRKKASDSDLDLDFDDRKPFKKLTNSEIAENIDLEKAEVEDLVLQGSALDVLGTAPMLVKREIKTEKAEEGEESEELSQATAVQASVVSPKSENDDLQVLSPVSRKHPTQRHRIRDRERRNDDIESGSDDTSSATRLDQSITSSGTELEASTFSDTDADFDDRKPFKKLTNSEIAELTYHEFRQYIEDLRADAGKKPASQKKMSKFWQSNKDYKAKTAKEKSHAAEMRKLKKHRASFK